MPAKQIACALLCVAAGFTAEAQGQSSDTTGSPVATDAAEESLDTIPVDSDRPSTKIAAPVRGSGSRIVEEIVVVAQKREERLQDVPISISAYSADALDARGATDTKSLATITPALSVTEFGGFTFIYIRGIGSDSFIPSADPSVTTYVDGVYVPTSQGLLTSFGGIERVEVLKGPQGTLFGRNSTGGAINVITRKPGDTFTGNLTGELGNYNRRSGKLYLNVPVTDWLSGTVDLFGSTIDNQYTHVSRDVPVEKQFAGRYRAYFHPTDNFSVDLTYFRTYQSGQGTLLTKNIDPSPVLGAPISAAAALGAFNTRDDYVANADFEARLKGTQDLKSATISWELPRFDTKLIGSDQVVNTSYTAFDFDATPLPLLAFTVAPREYTEAKTVELQILSNKDSWAADVLEWVGGVYWLKSEGGFADINIPLGNPQLDALGVTDALAAIGVDITPFVDPTVHATGLLATKSESAFAQFTYHATDWLALTLGGRYQREKRYLTEGDLSVAANDSVETPEITPFPLPTDKRSSSTDREVISFTPSDELLIYLSRSTGYKSATYNIVNLVTPPELVKPEEVTAYELGVKSTFLDGLLRLNAAIFRNNIKNKQSSIVSLTSGGVINFNNAEKARSDGVELDVVLVPLPSLDPGLVVTANGAYLDAKYLKYLQGQGFDEMTGVYFGLLGNTPALGVRSFAGNRIERTPRFSGGLGVSQTLDIPNNSEIELGLNGFYNSGYFYSAQNADNYQEDAYFLLDAHLSYLYRPWDLRITAVGNNILDERYHVGLFQTDFGVNSNLAYRTRYSLRLQWEF